MIETVSIITDLADALILLVTGVIVFLYTRETRKIRQETQRQVGIMSEELQMLKLRMHADEKFRRAKCSINLVFKPSSNDSALRQIELPFTNAGGEATELEVHAMPPLKARISPADIVDHDAEGNVEIYDVDGPEAVDEVVFFLKYRNELGEHDHKRYLWRQENRVAHEL